MNFMTFIHATAVCLIFGIAAPATAQMVAAAPGAIAGGANIQYANGGIGLDERAAIKNVAGNYNTLVMFTNSNGEFLIAKSVTLRKGNVDVLTVLSPGPLLYMQLPDGTYSLSADHDGTLRSRTLVISRRRTPDTVLVWPDEANRN